MLLLKCCTQYASKFGKLSSGHRTGKGQLSFQSQRKVKYSWALKLYKVRLVKAMVFPVVMYGCESWIVKKAECQRIDAFELWCWRRLVIPLDCKEIEPVHSKGDQSWVFI